MHHDQAFNKKDFTLESPAGGEYEACGFNHCFFSNTDLTGTVFIDCNFTGCDMSMAKLTGTTLQDCRFIDCKMLGLHFGDCNDFALSFLFENCLLDHSTFTGLKVPKTVFRSSRLIEVDFTDSDLTGSLFDECDLSGTVFSHTNIERADLRTSRNYSIDPERNRIRKARFSLYGIAGLLDKYDIGIEQV